jgi:hypothetical protein
MIQVFTITLKKFEVILIKSMAKRQISPALSDAGNGLPGQPGRVIWFN